MDVRADRSAGRLRRLWQMISSERLSQLSKPGTTGGRVIGAEFAAALRMAREDLGVDRVRTHAILHDDLGVYTETVDGSRFDSSRVDLTFHNANTAVVIDGPRIGLQAQAAGPRRAGTAKP